MGIQMGWKLGANWEIYDDIQLKKTLRSPWLKQKYASVVNVKLPIYLKGQIEANDIFEF